MSKRIDIMKDLENGLKISECAEKYNVSKAICSEYKQQLNYAKKYWSDEVLQLFMPNKYTKPHNTIRRVLNRAEVKDLKDLIEKYNSGIILDACVKARGVGIATYKYISDIITSYLKDREKEGTIK